jgi:predicted SAM-dependent methyltransferase
MDCKLKNMKLNLGCGDKKMVNFINVDIRENVKPDIVDDVSKLEKFNVNSIDLIYACHILEHFGRHEYKKVLSRWFNLLKEGGTLRLAVPNFESVCNLYIKNKKLSELIGLLYGGQTYPQNFHYYIWDFESLKKDLEEVGFKIVKLYDWRNTEHSHIDDYSQSYLPHMDKDNGTLMSLNVEAIK